MCSEENEIRFVCRYCRAAFADAETCSDHQARRHPGVRGMKVLDQEPETRYTVTSEHD